MIFKGILEDVQVESLIEIAKEGFSFLVRFFDDDRIFVAKIPDVGKSGSEHGVCGHESMPQVLV